MSNETQFEKLLSDVRETLDIEVKETLDIAGDPNHRAALAKEIIALANHGGGFVIIGYEEKEDGDFVPSVNRKPSMMDWSTDKVQSIISRYVDPHMQCSVTQTSIPNSEDRCVIIAVPGGHKVPVRAKSGSPDNKTLVPNRVYVRRPGPNSEEPQSTHDWDELFSQIIRNRREELSEAFRSILEGVVPVSSATEEPADEALQKHIDQARSRWHARTSDLPDRHAAKLIYGYYDCAFQILGNFDIPSFKELREIVQSSVRNHSGWPPFVSLAGSEYAPQIVDGSLEFWRGPNTDGAEHTPDHHDFWRISPDGLWFIRRGYPEDGFFDGMEQGKYLDISTPTRRVGEAIMEAAYIARGLGASKANIKCEIHYFKLAGRELVSKGNTNRMLFDEYKNRQDEYNSKSVVAVSQLPGSLPEVVYKLLAPLYQLFGFFSLPKRLVEEELRDLLRYTH